MIYLIKDSEDFNKDFINNIININNDIKEALNNNDKGDNP